MKISCMWLMFGILSACTCGGGTIECKNEIVKLSLLTSIHDDLSCMTISNKGVIIYEAAKLIADAHNMKSNNSMKIDIVVMDTCGSIAGTIKAAIRALVSTGLNCIHAPYHLGLIGPESSLDVDAVQKLTSILKVPQIVKSQQTTSPYLHHLGKEPEYFIVQAILEVIDVLRWNRFTLITRKYDNNHDDDVQVIAKKVTIAAIARGLCVLTPDEGDIVSVTSHIVHIGIPLKNFSNNGNGTVLIASEGSFTSYINKINSTNSVLFLEDTRNDFNDLQAQVYNSKWWTDKNNEDKYNSEQLRDIRWLKDAIDIYTTSLDILCKKKKCSNEINPAEWNTMIATVIATHNAKTAITPKKMKLLFKNSNDNFVEQIGEISILNNHAKFHWSQDNMNENLKNKKIIHESIHGILSNFDDKSRVNCAALLDVSNKNNSDDVARIFFATFTDHEWWTMVSIVGGIGVAMFTFGFIAVYIVYVNVRGPKRWYNNNGRRISRDLSLRQVSTPIHVSNNSPTSVPLPPQRVARFQIRRESNRSIKSNISDKSI